MEFRGRVKRRVIYPSFSLVIHKHLLWCVGRAYRRRIVWKSVPNYRPYPVPLQDTRDGDWEMMTIDCREEDDLRRNRRPVILPELDPFCVDTSTTLQAEPERVELPPIDDDAVSYISFLDLDGEETRDDVDRSAHARRVSKGARIFFTCKSFLEYWIQSVRKKKAAI